MKGKKFKKIMHKLIYLNEFIKRVKKQGYTIKVGSLGNYFIFNNKSEFVCAGAGYSIIKKFETYKNIDIDLNIWR